LNIILAIGNFCCLLGTILLTRTVIKNKKILQGYSLSGAMLTSIAVMLFCVAFAQMNEILSFVFAISTLIYWFTVSLYKIKNVS
jgi:hypothetical protein